MLPVDPQLTPEEMERFSQQAFLPHHCVAKFSDYDNIFGFAVYPEGHPREIHEEPAVRLANASELRRAITHVRQKLEKSGVVFEPWTFPSLDERDA